MVYIHGGGYVNGSSLLTLYSDAFVREQDVVLVGGVEKMTNLPTAEVTDTLATAADIPFEIAAGFTFPGLYAAMATAYMHRYGAQVEHLMHVAIKNHANGALNPLAQFGVSIPDWMQGRIAAAIKKGKPAPTWPAWPWPTISACSSTG